MAPRDVDPERTSRRGFLARISASATASVVAPIVLSGCRDEPPTATDVGATSIAPAPAARRPSLPDTEPIVRVRVRIIRDRARRLQFGNAGEWLALRTPEPNEHGHALPTREPGRGGRTTMLHAPVTVGVQRRGWTVVDAHGFRAAVDDMAPLELSRPDGEGVTIGDQPYPGYVQLVARGETPGDGWYVVNHVPIESYLPGVVAGELYSHWHVNTYAAQAVAARSYACAERTYRGHRPYDLTNTASSQVYTGATTHDRALEGVEMTRGMLLVHEDLLVPGYYSACCGGNAAIAVDAFGVHPFNDIAPLRGRPVDDVCVRAPLFTWTIERRHVDVVNRLCAYARYRKIDALKSMGRLRTIEVAAANRHGRPIAYSVTSDEGTAVLNADRLRSAVDYAGNGMKRPKRRLWSSNVDVTINGDTVRFEGRGHGHGVGMCQHGAQTLARASKSYRSILEWYYPGVEIVQAYGQA